LAKRSGRHKQVIGRLVDELEELGYVDRRPEPGDCRGKLVVPTERGMEVMRLSDAIVAGIEGQQARRLGTATWTEFRTTMIRVVESLTQHPPGAERPAS
jgi:DNA-binding MarR family transcriptional regulator